MNNKIKEQELFNSIVYGNCVQMLREAETTDEYLTIKKDLLKIQDRLFQDVFRQLMIFVTSCIKVNEKNSSSNTMISEATIFHPLSYDDLDLDGLNLIEQRINSIKTAGRHKKNCKIKYDLQGLYNLLADKNLVYNEIYKRNEIIAYLKPIRGLHNLKACYIHPNSLKSDYSFLSVKKDKILSFSKIQLINNCIVINTLNTDDISIKVLYMNKSDVKKFLRRYDYEAHKLPSKFNIDCLDVETINKLGKKDKVTYYTYLKRNLLNKTNRTLLKKVRKSSYTFSADRDELKEELIKELEELKKVDVKKLSDNIDVIYHYQDMEDINEQIISLDIQEDKFLNDVVENENNLSYRLKTYL